MASPANTASGPQTQDASQTATCPGCHEVVHASEWVWLPTARHGTLARHPWCRGCGEVKAVGAERALNLGGLVNKLGYLERRLNEHGIRMTEAQKRLIVRKLQDMGAVDTWGLTRDVQLELLTDAVGHYLGLHADTVRSYIGRG